MPDRKNLSPQKLYRLRFCTQKKFLEKKYLPHKKNARANFADVFV